MKNKSNQQNEQKIIFVENRKYLSVFSVVGLFFIAVLFQSGCKTPVKLPEVISETAKLEEIVKAVNENSAQIQTLRSDNVSFGTGAIAGWGVSRLAFQRPNRIRFVATVTMNGIVFDSGCNDELFWYWNKYDDPSRLVWANRNELNGVASPAMTIPIEPTWIPEALGVVEINFNEINEGPVRQSDGTILIVTRKNRPDGLYMKHNYLLPRSAAIKKQEIYDPQGNLILTIRCDDFQLKKINERDVILPKKLVISSGIQKESFHFDLGDLRLNAPNDITADLFKMPRPEDLGNPPVVNLKDIKNNSIRNDASIPPVLNKTGVAPVTAPPAGATTSTTTQNPTAQNPAVATMPAGSALVATGNVTYPSSFPTVDNNQYSPDVSTHMRTQIVGK